MKYGERETHFFRKAEDGTIRNDLQTYREDFEECFTAFEFVKIMEESDSWDDLPLNTIDDMADFLDVDISEYVSDGIDDIGLFRALYAACEKDW